MSKQDDDLSELQKLLDEELKKIETAQPKKGDEKKSLVDSVSGGFKIPVEDRYLYDILGAGAGSKIAGKIAGIVDSATPVAGGPVGGPAGPVGGPASLVPTDPMHTRQLQGTTDAGATGRARQSTFNEATAQQAARKNVQQGILSQLQQQGVITDSAEDILAKMPGMTSTPSGILAPSSAVYPAASSAPTPKPGALSQVAGALKQGVGAFKQGAGAVLNTPGVSGALGGLGVAESGQEFFQRRAAGDVPGQFLAGMGMVGGGMAMVPNPMAKAIGASLATASPLSLYLYDKIRAPSDAPELTDEERMFASRPAFGVYPKPMPRPPLRPRIPEPGTNLPPVEFIR